MTSEDAGLEPGLDGPEQPAVEFWTEERKALLSWFNQNAVQLAPVYQAAVHFSQKGFPGWVYLLAHSVREIRNRLPGEMAEEVKVHTDYTNLTSNIHKRWTNEGFPEDGSLAELGGDAPHDTGPDSYEISKELFTAISHLVAGHVAATSRNKSKARLLIEATGGGPAHPDAVKAWVESGEWCVKYAHIRDKPIKNEDEQIVAEGYERFERALISITSRSYENMDELDDILDATNP